MFNSRRLQLARQAAIGFLVVAVVLWAWRHDRVATRFAFRGTSVVFAVGWFCYLYVRCLNTVVDGSKPRYRIVELLSLCVPISILGVAGFAADGLTLGCLILYTAICGPLLTRLVRRWAKDDMIVYMLASAAIFGSFVLILTVAALVVVIANPRVFESFATVYWVLVSSFYTSFEYILHDEADSAAQLFLYGIPFGLPANLIVGLLIGAVLGVVARLNRRATAD